MKQYQGRIKKTMLLLASVFLCGKRSIGAKVENYCYCICRIRLKICGSKDRDCKLQPAYVCLVTLTPLSLAPKINFVGMTE